MKTLKPCFLALSLMCWAGPSHCLAQTASIGSPSVVVFDSFGPGNSYYTAVVWGVSGAASSYGYRGQAEWFVPGASGQLRTIELATYRQSGSGRSDFFIAEDNGSGIPGTILESYLNFLNKSSGLLTLVSSSKPLLEAGVKYWICDEPADSSTSNGWYENNQNYAPGFAYERSEWGWDFVEPDYAPPSGVMRISVTPVPEPGVASLLLVGLLPFVSRLRKSHVAKRSL